MKTLILGFGIAFLLGPLSAQADDDSIVRKLEKRGVRGEKLSANFDGSLSFHYPLLKYNHGFLYLEGTEKAAAAFCHAIGRELSSFDAQKQTSSMGIDFLKLKLDAKKVIVEGIAEMEPGTEILKNVVCSAEREDEKQLSKHLNAGLKQLKDLNGVDLRKDGSVVIDTKKVKQIHFTGNGQIVVHAQENDAGTAQ